MQEHSCPLCNAHFVDDGSCHAGCPMSASCSLVRCPKCGFEYPDPTASVAARWLSRLFRKNEKEAP